MIILIFFGIIVIAFVIYKSLRSLLRRACLRLTVNTANMSKRVLKLEINKVLFEQRYLEIKEALFKDDKKLRIYIDTNIFGRAIDGKIDATEASSLRRIMSKRDDLDIYTSEKTRKEISNHPNKNVQDYLQFIMTLAGVIPEENFVWATWHFTVRVSSTWRRYAYRRSNLLSS